jgi:ribosomal protein L12E/L44/L45/RPP1/RPP2
MEALYGNSKVEFALTLAAMILHDGDAEVTPENLKTLVDAAGVEVPGYWPGIFAKGVEGKIDDFICSVGGGGGGGGGGDAAAADAGAADAAPEKKEKPKEEEIDFSGGVNMFGGGEGGGDY